MALRILQVGDPVLRQAARPLSVEEIRSETTRKLIADMRETMYAAPGVGLAAPQIGVPSQVAVIEDREEWIRDLQPQDLIERGRRPVPFHTIINPRITDLSHNQAEFFEGCLSLGGFTAIVPRSRNIRVECLDENAQPKIIDASGWYARILQHEVDHLHGTVYIDSMHSRTFMGMDNFNLHWKEIPIHETRRLLINHEPDGSS